VLKENPATATAPMTFDCAGQMKHDFAPFESARTASGPRISALRNSTLAGGEFRKNPSEGYRERVPFQHRSRPAGSLDFHL
jgi:hypothetical protein